MLKRAAYMSLWLTAQEWQLEEIWMLGMNHVHKPEKIRKDEKRVCSLLQKAPSVSSLTVAPAGVVVGFPLNNPSRNAVR